MLHKALSIYCVCCCALLLSVGCDEGASVPPEGFHDNPNVRDMMPPIRDALPITLDMGMGGQGGQGGMAGLGGSGGTAGLGGMAGAGGDAGAGGQGGF